MFAHLRRNAKRLAAQNVHLRDSDEDGIRTRFQKAKDLLVPLEARIKFTDALINHIVYALVVEGGRG